MLVACINEIIWSIDIIWTFSWYLSLDTIIVSTYVAVLMLILMIKNCPCRPGSAEDYNKIAIENSNSVLPAGDESLNASNAMLNDKIALKAGKASDTIDGPKRLKITKSADSEEDEGPKS